VEADFGVCWTWLILATEVFVTVAFLVEGFGASAIELSPQMYCLDFISQDYLVAPYPSLPGLISFFIKQAAGEALPHKIKV
jgi:hypothetical protein